MKKLMSTLLLLITTTIISIAQQSMLPVNDTELVKKVVLELFNSYRAGDSLRIKSTFTSNAMLQTAYYSEAGKSTLSNPSPISKFISYIGGGFEQEHDERLWDIEVNINNNLASVWAKYAFYLGGKFSHCGAENFLLIKQNSKWKIFYLVDTRQQKDCKIPESIQNR